MIKLDTSKSATHCSVVVICTQCSYWRAFALSPTEGWASGARHQALVHPEHNQAQKALDQQRWRNSHR